jgi:hypothetical protein
MGVPPPVLDATLVTSPWGALCFLLNFALHTITTIRVVVCRVPDKAKNDKAPMPPAARRSVIF